MKTKTSATTKAQRLEQVTEEARIRLGLDTLQTRNRDALDFHDTSVASIREIIALAFEAGFAAGNGAPAPFTHDAQDPGALLDTLELAKIERRKHGGGGTWVSGSIGGHCFNALVFPEHATDPAFELDGSRISKLWLKDSANGTEVASFDRGWDRSPATDTAQAIVGLLAAGLAERVFGE
ncbi:MAG: hypothetical protein Q8L55_06600 [Phycisphaerales bacterium]|nr:hypothetical protein [Phycisphaerales bacterium]